MRSLVVTLLVLAAVAIVPSPADAAPPCHPDQPCCRTGEIAIGWRCVGPCTVLDCERASVNPFPYCESTLDDMISDGGSTYCVDPHGECTVSESREYIWGREYHCIVP